MEKRGQFYILAAFIIVIVIIGLNLIYNSARAPAERKGIYDLADEAGYEAKQLFNNMLLNNKNNNEIGGEMKEMMEYYAKRYANVDMTIVFGNKDDVRIVNSTKIESKTGDKVDVIVGGDSRTLEFKETNSIYTIVRAERNGEKIFIQR